MEKPHKNMHKTVNIENNVLPNENNYHTWCLPSSNLRNIKNFNKPIFLKIYSRSMKFQRISLTLCIRETPKWVLLQTVRTQMKCHILRHFIRVHTVCMGKKIFRQKNTILKKISPTPLDTYNGPSQVHFIKPVGRTH